MSVGLSLVDLLDYSDLERGKWREWVAADPRRLNLIFQAGARVPTGWSLVEHIFLIERRHLARLEGGTPNVGGSLPNDCFAEVLGLPTVWVPHSYAGCSQHAPDEHVLAPVLREGLQIMTGLFWDLGERGIPRSA